jgi:hypothetical protein
MADDTFEAHAQSAIRVKRLDNVVWALTATCDDHQRDDTQQRQCRRVRDARAAQLAGATLLVDADADAFDVGAWNSLKKALSITVAGCIRCAGVDVDGKTWLVVGGVAPPSFAGGKPKPAPLAETSRPFAEEEAGKVWTKTVANAKVQMVVRVPPKPRWAIDGKLGISLEILAFRVVSPCDGQVVVASPPAKPVDPDKKQCKVQLPSEPAVEAPSLDALSASDIRQAMQPVADAAAACYEQYGVAGKARLKLTVLGDGSVGKYEQQGDFVGTDTGKCIDAAAAKLVFPKTKKPKTTFSVPLQL